MELSGGAREDGDPEPMAATCANERASFILPDFEVGLSAVPSTVPWLVAPRLSRGPSAREDRPIVGRVPWMVSERFLAIFCGMSALALAFPFDLLFFDCCAGSPAVTVLVIVDIAMEYGTTCPRAEFVGPLVERRPDS